MSDTYAPSFTVVPNGELLAMATLEKTDLLANDLVQVMLYQNAATINRNIELGDLEECDFGGYDRIAIESWDGPHLDTNGNAYLLAPLAVFTCDGSGSNTVQGMAVLKANGGAQATATNAGNGSGDYNSVFTITDGGSGYESPPRVRLTGEDGAGATAHALITNGEVTSIVLDNPGDGAYTTFTVTIDEPQSIVTAGPFPTPINMSADTDALPVVPEVEIPAISVS